jgi:membrane peptidoglycan carboxypeptidase
MQTSEIKLKEQIYKNLEENGFPEQPISFPVEKLYEVAHNAKANLNTVLQAMEEEGVLHEMETERIVFKKSTPEEVNETNPMNKAKEMMDNMSPEELNAVQDMILNMSDEDKNKLMEQANSMGLL